ncbi:MAG TPA: CehA/McbA family metallohydrolase [Caulobacteraceae bacterium]
MRRTVLSAALVLAALVLAALAGAGGATAAGREPVLKQIDLPHDYYWREQYLPQLTAGPSSAAFTPDGKALIYSMAGSLWRQAIGTDKAVELTHAVGAYDYQPDVAPDGRSLVFSRYDGAAIELWRLDLESGREQKLTSAGAVNVEPRLSPQGKRLAWVSTEGTGHFNLFVADVGADGALFGARRLLGDRKSKIDRYYYSAFDHALNPSWSPDGVRIYFVGNSEVAWGTGDIWSVSASDPSDRRKVLSEETMWSAHPEPAPDGHRVLFSSYHGRQWRQLWLTTPDGAAPLPLTFGEFDRSDARWSLDGKRIAYISNEPGDTELVVQDVLGGATTPIVARDRRFKLAQAQLTFDIRDENGRPTPARVTVMGSDDRAYAPDHAWMRGEDAFDRARQQIETHYFHCPSTCTLTVPAGPARITVQHGFRHLIWHGATSPAPGAAQTLKVELEPNDLPAGFGTWRSADLHVHMNYGGHYRDTPERLAAQAQAEDLSVIYDLIVNKEERVPDVGYFRPGPDPASDDETLILHGQEFHTSFWGHLGLLNLNDHLLTPGFASYRHTALASPYPHNGVVADLAHAQGALVGYVHPYDAEIVPDQELTLSHQLPADAAYGKVDYVEVMGFSDHKATANVWYRLLNLGDRLPAGAGTDAMANYASMRGPVGLNRVFLDTGGERTPAALAAALKAGRTFVSNGPLLGLDLAGRHPGDTVVRDGPGKLAYRIALRSPVAVDHLELVQNGQVLKRFDLIGDRRDLDAQGEVEVRDGGWLLLRAWNDGADPAVLDLYPYATTSPIYLQQPGGPPPAPQDAAYFVTWMLRVLSAAEARDDYNTDEERRATLDYLRGALEHYRALAGSALSAR